MVTIVNVADAVKTLLAATVFTTPVTATRAYLPVFDLEQLATLRVTVTPKSVEYSIQDRTNNAELHTVNVFVQQKIDADDSAAIDALQVLCGEIIEALNRANLPTSPPALWVGTEHDPVFAADVLKDNRSFFSVIAATYRVAQ